MRHMAAGPGELCSPCELCSCRELWQAQEDAALKILMRQKGEARISVNKWLHTVFKVPPASYRAECLACCLAPFLSKLWKCCWKLMLSLLIFFLFFFSFLFPPFLFSTSACGFWQEARFRWQQRESRAARGWGSWEGSRVCSKSRGFCSYPLLHSLLAARGMIIQPFMITMWVSPFSCKGAHHWIYGFNAEKKKKWVFGYCIKMVITYWFK